jgi:nitroreductase
MKSIQLPKPSRFRGLSLYESLERRKTARAYESKKLPLQTLSNLLWAAFGVNRENGPFGDPGRTAASASNSQEIDIYVLLQEGAYLYVSHPHQLNQVASGDIRWIALGPRQGMNGAEAAVRLIYVANIARFSTAGYQEPGLYDQETQKAYFYVDTGLIAQNVYLFAASQGFAAWFHNCNKEEAMKLLRLSPTQLPLFGQTVGYELPVG